MYCNHCVEETTFILSALLQEKPSIVREDEKFI